MSHHGEKNCLLFLPQFGGKCDANFKSECNGYDVGIDEYTRFIEQGPDGFWNNFKGFGWLTKKYRFGCDASLTFKASASFKPVFNSLNVFPNAYAGRIRNIDEDVRLSFGSLLVYDKCRRVLLGFVMSGNAVYVIHARIPHVDNQNECNNKGGFVQLHFMTTKTECGCADLDFAIKLTKCSAVFTVGSCHFCIDQIGVRGPEEEMVAEYGGSNLPVELKEVYYGFGLGTGLDWSLPHNYARNYMNSANGNISLSALYRQLPAQNYYEVYPNSYGRNEPINPAVTFAVNNGNEGPALFSGGCLKVRHLRVCYDKICKPVEHCRPPPECEVDCGPCNSKRRDERGCGGCGGCRSGGRCEEWYVANYVVNMERDRKGRH